MRALGLRPVQLTFSILAAAAVAVALLLLSSGATEASHGATTESSTNYTYSASASSAVAGAPRGTVTTFSVPYPGNINFGNLITFDPAATLTQNCNTTLVGGFATEFDGNGDGDTIHPGEGDLAAGSCLKAGDLAGTLTSTTNLSSLNNACFQSLGIDFDLTVVPVPNRPDDPRASTNIAYPQPEGTGDRFSNWGTSPIVGGGGTVLTYVSDPNKADNTNIPLTNYPVYLLDLFDPDGAGSADPLVPVAVYGGIAKVFTNSIPLYFVFFAPGQLAANFDTPNPAGRGEANLGYFSQTVLTDPTATSASPSPITSFCATTSVTTLNPTVGGITRATNPAAGTALNLAWVASARDLDNDGIENSVDSCPLVDDVDGDPRIAGNDPDGNNIDAGCAAASSNDDFDSDTWPNIQDNCPLISNASQTGSEVALGVEPGYQASPGRANDGGPLGDAMGDACDTGTNTFTYNGLSTTITSSPTIANGRWQARAFVEPICYGGTDSDGDGYCAGDADGFDANPNRWNSWTTDPDLYAVLGQTCGLSCTTGAITSAGSWDTDSGSGDVIAGLNGVPDGGFDSDFLETYLGIDARQPCSLSSGLNDEPLDAWIFDTNDDGKAALLDVLPVTDFFNGPAEDPTVVLGRTAIRFDWNADGFVTLLDVLSISPVFNSNCIPVVAAQ